MIKKIIDDGTAKINGNLHETRKLYLLSGHEINCALMLRLLGTFEPHLPPYGAHVIFELHEIDNVFGYKVSRLNF